MRNKDYITGFIFSSFIAILSVVSVYAILYFESKNLNVLKILFIIAPISELVYFKDKSIITLIYKQSIYYISFIVLIVLLSSVMLIFVNNSNYVSRDFLMELLSQYGRFSINTNEESKSLNFDLTYLIDILLFILSNFVCTILSIIATIKTNKRIQKKYVKIYKKHSISK